MNPASQGKDNWWRPAFVLLLGYIGLYLVPLGFRPLMRLDEFRYAAAAQEMLAGGDWIVPHLNGVRYFEKPILGYWIDTIALALFGHDAFAVRLPAALSTGLVALFTGWFLARFTDARTGILAAFVYLTSLFVYGIGTMNVLDPQLNLWLTLALGSFYLAETRTTSHRRQALLALTGLFCGLAFMTKGFLAFAVPVVVAVPFLLWQRHWARLLTDVWAPMLAATLVILPWALAIHAREPDFWHYFFWVEHIQRFLADNAQHSEPWWYFLILFPALSFPWIFLLPAAVAGLRRTSADRPLTVYLLCWFVMPFVFFSTSRGKLMSYILPCMPAFAMLMALGLRKLPRPAESRIVRRSLAALSLAYAAGASFLLLNGLGLAGERLYQGYETSRWIIAIGSFAIGALLSGLALVPAASRRWPGLVGGSLIGVMIAVQFVLPDDVRWSKAPGQFFSRQASLTSPDAILISDGGVFRAVNWAFRRSDVYLLDDSELDYGLAYPEDAHRKLTRPGALATLIAQNAGHREIVLVVKDSREQILTDVLPHNAQRIQWGQFVVWRIPATGADTQATAGDTAGP